jgi:hypothetical protein
MTERVEIGPLVEAVKALLHELDVGEDFTVDHMAARVRHQLQQLQVSPNADYDRALGLANDAWLLLALVDWDEQTPEWKMALAKWRDHFHAEMMRAARTDARSEN